MRFYFTFGTDPAFPFHEKEFVEVHAESMDDACKKYMHRYPSRAGSPGVCNCAFIYDENKWEKIREKYYKGIEPAKIIV